MLWIDDEIDRRHDADVLCDKQLEVAFSSTALAPCDLADCDLLLVDYKLQKLSMIQIDGKQVPINGPAIVGLLRSVSDEIPAYMVSSESAAKRRKLPGWSWFEDDFDLAQVQDVGAMRSRLKRDIAAYRRIRNISRGPGARPALVKLLKVPSTCQSAVYEALPVNLLGWWTKTLMEDHPKEIVGMLGFSRWVRRMLLARPGPLLPTLHAATRVGLDEERFRANARFRGCRYSGVFADSLSPMWWRRCVDKVVFTAQVKHGIPAGAPHVVGPKVFRLTNESLLKCAVCGEQYPEAVARDNDDPTFSYPVHTRCSQPDPGREFTPFFDAERICKVPQ